MLTYQIHHAKGLAKSSYKTKQTILEAALRRSFFKVGDRVKFKKPKRSPIYGTITHIEEAWDLVTWTNGGIHPCNITVLVEDGVKSFNAKTSAKRLVLAAYQKGN